MELGRKTKFFVEISNDESPDYFLTVHNTIWLYFRAWFSATVTSGEIHKRFTEIFAISDLSFFPLSLSLSSHRCISTRFRVKSSRKFGANPLAGWQGAKLNVVRDKRHYGDARRFIFLWLARFLRLVADETIVWFIEKGEILLVHTPSSFLIVQPWFSDNFRNTNFLPFVYIIHPLVCGVF